MQTTTQRSRLDWIFCLGLVLVLVTVLPSLVLRGRGAVTIGDSLDGEVTVYTLQAKHLGDASIPEFIAGGEKTTLTPASYGTLGFYLIFKPQHAYVLNAAFVQLMAYVGMYLLLRRLRAGRMAAMLTGAIYSLLPCFSVYGLGVMGQPLLFWACLAAWDGRKAWPYLTAALFAVFSSPVLAGYADCGLILLAAAILSLRGRREARGLWLILLILIAVYVALYFDLLAQVFGGASYVSHKVDYIVDRRESWWETFLTAWHTGHYHAVSNHKTMMPYLLAALAALLICWRVLGEKRRKHALLLLGFIGATALIAAFYATWRYGIVADFRERVRGLLVTFQADRIYWLNPCLWYAALGLAVNALLAPADTLNDALRVRLTASPARKWLCRLISWVLGIALLGTAAVPVWNDSFNKKNVDFLVKGQAETSLTFDHFYSEALFDEIDAYIGLPKDTYRVGSVALYPAVPLYNGFYCIDGYSNNYDVNYKRAFREVIAEELDKSPELAEYFDTFGNRCYLFSADVGKRYYLVKSTKLVINDLRLNHDALYALGCEYIFSGVEIVDPAPSGLVFLRTFERADSPYRIWLYQVTPLEKSAATD